MRFVSASFFSAIATDCRTLQAEQLYGVPRRGSFASGKFWVRSNPVLGRGYRIRLHAAYWKRSALQNGKRLAFEPNGSGSWDWFAHACLHGNYDIGLYSLRISNSCFIHTCKVVLVELLTVLPHMPKQPIFDIKMAEASGRIKLISSDEVFEKELREAGDKLVVVDFFSEEYVFLLLWYAA